MLRVEQRLNSKEIFIDSHAHLDQLNEKVDHIIAQSRRENVKYIVNVGYNLQSSEFSAYVSKNYLEVFGSVGIHPHYADLGEVNDLQSIVEKYSDNSKIIALGEIGLDYVKSETTKNEQFETLEQQLSIAQNWNLPVIIHNRSADEDILSIIDNYSSVKGVFHCFSSDKSFARKILDRGFYISFAGNITFPKNDSLREVLKWIPIEFILLETDAPYLSPQIFRGKENHPINVKYIYELAVKLKNMSIEEFSQVVYNNFINLFLRGKDAVNNG